MYKILHDLYHGNIPGWDSQFPMKSETTEAKQKIRSEQQYFMSILSDEDVERFKALDALHKEGHTRRYRNTYVNAFKLGVLLMCAVFADGEPEK